MSVEPGERGRLVCLLQQVVDEQFEILSLPAERDDADISDAGASAVVRPVIVSLFSPCWGPSFFSSEEARRHEKSSTPLWNDWNWIFR